ncbi:hypothetical protein [Aureivirga sp. CE67]|uniref:hypothetical protein n=1 Tax=Aureivirga sp. CE67 TaxID=1788983 RepID=UPI0018CA0F2F|nr:hypothetical protein [Aureivirga sp. CE67]
MKKLLIFSLLIISNFVLAQSESTTNLTVKESIEYKEKINSIDILAIHTSESGKTAIARNGKKNIFFDIFDNNLNKTFSKTIKSNRKEKYVGDLYYNNQLKLFTVYAPKKDERILYCHTLDLNSTSYTKTVIFETTVEKKQNLFGSRKNHNTSFSLSPNGKYFAIATDNIRKNKNSYTIRVFDAKTEKLIYTKAYQEDIERYFIHNDLFIDNDATTYSLGKLYLNDRAKEKSKGEANYQYILNKISKEKNEELVIDLKEKYIQSLKIFQVKEQLQLYGFYSELKANRIKGGCSFIINKSNLSLQSLKSKDLPKKVYEDLYGYRTAKRKNKKKKELKNFYIDYILKDSKDGVYLIAEEFFTTTRYVNAGVTAGGYYETIYHYDDLLILKFDSAGDLAWGRSVFKRADTPSYNAFLKDEKLHIILNSGKNLSKKKDGRTKISKGFFESSALYDFEYSSDGKVSYNKIQDNKGKKYYTPYYGTYQSERFVMMNSRKKKKTFMILE